MKRRKFLTAGASATAAALTPVFPSILSAQTAGISNGTAPNSRIGIGLIGNGKIMVGHREYFALDDRTEVVGVCDVAKNACDRGASQVEDISGKRPDTYEDYEDLLARDDLDAVVIGTPDHWHAALAIAAMKAGKDVYVEKPMTLTVEESRAVVSASERYGRVVQVGSQQRSDWRFRKAAEMVRNGWIGELKEIYARLGSFPPASLEAPETIPEGFNYDRWLGPTPYESYFEWRVKGDYGGGWRCYWEYGSRKNGDWGAHHFDIIQWALGMDDSGPTLLVPKGYRGEPYQYHQYANGLKVIRDHPDQRGHMIRFIGEDGEVLVSRSGLETDPPELARKPLGAHEQRLYFSDDHRGNWLDCIHSRSQPICHAGIGHHSGTICYLSGIAERLERPIQWDPANEVVLDDAVASRMLDRPRRSGYPLPV